MQYVKVDMSDWPIEECIKSFHNARRLRMSRLINMTPEQFELAKRIRHGKVGVLLTGPMVDARKAKWEKDQRFHHIRFIQYKKFLVRKHRRLESTMRRQRKLLRREWKRLLENHTCKDWVQLAVDITAQIGVAPGIIKPYLLDSKFEEMTTNNVLAARRFIEKATREKRIFRKEVFKGEDGQWYQREYVAPRD